MLIHIKVAKFKSLKKIEIDLGKITVLVGLNGSGKSSVIQVLGILKQSLHSQALNISGDLLNLGDFNDIVSRGETTISFSIGGESRIDGRPLTRFQSPTEYGYTIVFDQNGIVSSDSSIKIGKSFLDGVWKRGVPQVPETFEIAKNTLQYISTNEIGVPIRYFGGNIGTTLDEYEESKKCLERILGVIETDIKSISIVPAGRGIDRYKNPLEDSPRQDIMDSSGISQQASHLTSTIAYRREIEERISEFVYRITGIKVRHKLIPNKEVSIETDNEINIVNEGFGSNQLDHLFTQIETCPQGSLVAIEEPEIHLHPKAQAEIAGVLTDISKQKNINFLISTHSEHFLFRLLTDVASGRLQPNELNVYYFEIENGFTTVKKLDVDQNGTLSGGLKGFFETDLEEFSRFLGARKQ
jgi:energy-coupling factor transporter ATP-binding protein EcfA2